MIVSSGWQWWLHQIDINDHLSDSSNGCTKLIKILTVFSWWHYDYPIDNSDYHLVGDSNVIQLLTLTVPMWWKYNLLSSRTVCVPTSAQFTASAVTSVQCGAVSHCAIPSAVSQSWGSLHISPHPQHVLLDAAGAAQCRLSEEQGNVIGTVVLHVWGPSSVYCTCGVHHLFTAYVRSIICLLHMWGPSFVSCTCGVHHLFPIAALFIKEHKLQVFQESRDKWPK